MAMVGKVRKATVLREGERVHARSDLREFDSRLQVLVLLFAVVTLLLIARLWSLQVRDGAHYQRIAGDNFVRVATVEPERGRIFDAAGRLIAESRPSYDVYVNPALLRASAPSVEILTEVLSLSEAEQTRLAGRLRGARGDLVVRRDITRDQLALLETRRHELSGVYVHVSQRRFYPFHEMAAHLVGYVNEVTADELLRLAEHGYQPGDMIGRAGVERTFEAILRGAEGVERQVVDARGRPQPASWADALLGESRLIQPVPGRDISLTMDMRLQEVVQEIAGDTVSAGIVVLDPRDGAVLAMHSRPGFNPNAWAGRLSEAEKRQSDNNPFHPMLDKTIQSYFPGSTWKVVTALAGLQERLITPDEEVHCPGSFRLGNRVFRCWKRSGHGHVNLRSAMAVSCDVYFYVLGLRLGIDRMARYAYDLGFAERTGVGLPGESAGVVPTREWHQRNSPGGFQQGFTVNTSVGQGDTRASPLQVALAYAAIAMDGALMYPRLLDRIALPDGAALYETHPRVRRRIPVDHEHMAALRLGLEDAIMAPIGTAHGWALPYMRSAGKTGTSQVRALDTVRLDGEEIFFRDRDHAWFVVWAPAEEPEIVVSVFVEHGGAGSQAAAPLAMRIVDTYLRELRGYGPEIAHHQGRRPRERAGNWRPRHVEANQRLLEGPLVSPDWRLPAVPSAPDAQAMREGAP